MENSAVFFYILIIVALSIKGVLDIIWKKASKDIIEIPPIDAPKVPNRTIAERKKKNKYKMKPSGTSEIFAKGDEFPRQEYAPNNFSIAENEESPILKEEEQTFDIPAIQNTDDIKKAIIYSEIINRKYI